MVDRGAVRLVLGLAALNVLAYVDRQLLAALAPLIMADLGLTRADIGLLVGVTFIAVFALGTAFAGAFADRGSRPRLMAAGLGAWSVATALTGTATGFASLAAWRALVGVGEATLPPTALSMIGDRVVPERRGLASGVFYAGVPLGFALAFALAGWLGPWLGWRACFLLLGPLGLLAVAFVWRMTDPPRRVSSAGGARPRSEADPGPATAPWPGPASTARALARAVKDRPALVLLAAGAVLVVFASAASQHAITWLVQERGFEFRRAALLSSAMLLAGGLVGSLTIGALTDRARRHGAGARLVALGALGALGLLAAFAFYTLAPGSPWFLPCWFLAQCWLMGWYGPCVTALDEMAPPGLKATTVGASLLLINLLGVATGPYVAGVIGDHWGLTAGLLWSLLPAAVGVLLFVLVGVAEESQPGSDAAA